MGLLLPLDNANTNTNAKAKGKAKQSHHIITTITQEKLLLPKKRPCIYKPKPMEEMMMVMMNIRSQYQNTSPLNIPITTTTTCPTWKLYENPFYISSHHNKPQQIPQNRNLQQQQDYYSSIDQKQQIHRLHLPVSARKIAASFWDLTFIKPFMESELEIARAEIEELKAELESQRKARKKMENLNKRLARELSEQKKGREALERVCEELAKEISIDKAHVSRMKKEMEEERKMLRTAEVIREERVQMKLAEAKILLEEKLSELEIAKKTTETSSSNGKKEGKLINSRENVNSQSMAVIQRKGSSPETENPHIKRGIKGFVEFPKVVRAIGCRSSKHLSSKLECQKAQLKILLKQKGPVRFNGLIAS